MGDKLADRVQCFAMSILNRILQYFRATPQPQQPSVLPDGQLRIHLLCGDFDSSDAAYAYCFASAGDAPEQLTVDQPGAFIDTGFVEVVYQNPTARLTEFLSDSDAERIVHQMRGAKTLVIISEDAFGGFPYVLTSNDRLHYIGPEIMAG